MSEASSAKRYLPSGKVQVRYNRCGRTIDRWTRDPKLGFPKPIVIRGNASGARPYSSSSSVIAPLRRWRRREQRSRLLADANPFQGARCNVQHDQKSNCRNNLEWPRRPFGRNRLGCTLPGKRDQVPSFCIADGDGKILVCCRGDSSGCE